MNDLSIQLQKILLEKFNFKNFRPGQLEAITTVIETGRLLCIQPTGHGKSLLYQIPAVFFEGITIVISPLLALMRDQIHQLNNRFNIPAASINSDQTNEENFQAQQAAIQNKIKILFVSPEKLDHIEYFNFLRNLSINLIVIDEAHCISTWGHDFRPGYRQIIHFIHEIEQSNKNLKVLAITATANYKTEQDIIQQLGKFNKAIPVQRQSMDRANIKLAVLSASGVMEKLNLLLQLIEQLPGNGLIYCATRENTELVAEFLQSMKINAAAYHAGLDSEKKKQLQHNFIHNHYKVISATNALGMGIDKQDLRFIIHFDLPGSITAYYQEVGRSGRDGQEAYGILLFDEADKRIQQYFIDSAQPSIQDFNHIIECIQNSEAPGLMDIKRLSGLHPSRVNVIMAELVEQKFLNKKSQNRKQVYYLENSSKKLDLSRYQNQLEVRTVELNEMLKYGKQSSVCLMKLLRIALGDSTTECCGHCNVCGPFTFTVRNSQQLMDQVKDWLNFRECIISGSSKTHLSEGMAVFNAQMRSPIFIHFMKNRTTATMFDLDLLELMKLTLKKLCAHYSFKAVIPIPSRTWLGRDLMAKWVANYLGVDVFLDYLQWQKTPESRQGELLNNDQRRHNVSYCMQAEKIKIPSGTILLIDDYIGSGATMHEATRVIYKNSKANQSIVPFTIAMVKWHLGKRGMI